MAKKKKPSSAQRAALKVVHKNQGFTLELTQLELVHLRDLFGALLPNGTQVSKAVAAAGNHVETESVLWDKIVDACDATDVPVGDAAPDYTVTLDHLPISVFRHPAEGDDE